jgi:hypothetical protein
MIFGLLETILIAFDLWDVIEAGIQPQQSPEVADGSGDEESEAEQTTLQTSTTSREIKIKNAKALSFIQGALIDDLFPTHKKREDCKRSLEHFEQRIQRR